MEKIEPITIINVDEVPHAVSDMSENVKRLVSIYNDWRNDEDGAKSELLKNQAAMRDLSREIVMTIKQEKETKAQEEAAIQQAQEDAQKAAEPTVAAELEGVAATPEVIEAAAKEIGAINAE